MPPPPGPSPSPPPPPPAPPALFLKSARAPATDDLPPFSLEPCDVPAFFLASFSASARALLGSTPSFFLSDSLAGLALSFAFLAFSEASFLSFLPSSLGFSFGFSLGSSSSSLGFLGCFFCASATSSGLGSGFGLGLGCDSFLGSALGCAVSSEVRPLSAWACPAARARAKPSGCRPERPCSR